MRPGEEIRLVKRNLSFAVAFWKAAQAGRVPPTALIYPGLEASRPSGSGVALGESGADLSVELTRGAANQMRAAFALAALQSRRSLGVAFPGEPIEQELPELRTALSVMYLIALAVRRSIIQPVWECPPPYRRLFHIRRLGLTLNATGLKGQPLNWDHFGGLDSYVDLLEYCAASADESGNNVSEQGKVVLPDRPSLLDFDDIIGLPPAEHYETAETPGVRLPADYNGGEPPSSRFPQVSPRTAPPAEPLAPAPAELPVVPSQFGGSPAVAVPNFGVSAVDRFVMIRCDTGEGKRILAGELYAGFAEWSRNAGEEPISQRAFGMRLTALGLRRKRRGHGKHWWEGIRLAEPSQTLSV